MEMYIGGRRVRPLELSYNKSMRQLGASVKAAFPISDIEANVSAELGDVVTVEDSGQSRFQGMVTEFSRDRTKLTVTAYDHCYQLNKSKMMIQLEEMEADDAIREVVRQLGLKLRYIPAMSAKINATCYIQSPSEIIKSFISEEESVNGGEYYMTSEAINTIEIRKVGSLRCGVSLSAFISPSRSASLNDVKNRISLLVADGNGYTVTETACDNSSIQKYGEIHDYVKISSEASTAVASAQNRLAMTKRPLAEGSVTVDGNWALTAVGQRIAVNEPVTGFGGNYIITAVQHKLGDDFKTTLTLREGADEASFKADLAAAQRAKMLAFKESRMT